MVSQRYLEVVHKSNVRFGTTGMPGGRSADMTVNVVRPRGDRDGAHSLGDALRRDEHVSISVHKSHAASL